MTFSSFCNENFNCSWTVITPETCFDYLKLPADINCFFPCLLENCTKIPNSESSCLDYNCIGIVKPTVEHQNWTTIILSSFFGLFFLVLFAAGFWYYKYKHRSQVELSVEEQMLVNNQSQSPQGQEDEPSAPSATESNEA